MLPPGLHPIPPGHVAAVVTHLEMTALPPGTPDGPPDWPDGVTLRAVPTPDTGWYHDLFTRVGALDWLWFSRLQMTDAALATTLAEPGREIFSLDIGGRAEGLLELNATGPDTCELAFLGLTRTAQGRGLGRKLIAEATRRAFAQGIARFTIHTCTFDSPPALPLYMESGFVPVRREIEVVPDPRLTGTLPADAAPHIPVIPT